LTIDTKRLLVQDGARVSASTYVSRGGHLSVTASDSVELSGTSADGKINSGLFTQTVGAGNAGSLRIKTGELIVRDGAEVRVSATDLFGVGDALGAAGSIEVGARSIRLDNGNITATTSLGNGGNIRLQVQDLLLLRNGSQISTSTGTTQKGGDGGNISINTPFIVAVPPESANAFTGKESNIRVTAQAILDRDPSRGLANLPTEVVDASNQIGQTCPAGGKVAQNEFTVTGRGGLPDNPSETLSNDAVWTDLRPIPQTAATRLSSQAAKLPTHSKAVSLVEAQGWVINHQGQVVLTASAPAVTPQSSRLTPAQCHVP
jgi:large exoprotein involved in heme utilization and adhesion